jgi:hypothetical protein
MDIKNGGAADGNLHTHRHGRAKPSRTASLPLADDPAIHDFLCRKDVDARDKPGHDGEIRQASARKMRQRFGASNPLRTNVSSASIRAGAPGSFHSSAWAG